MTDKQREAKWQAEDDARTLASANEIMSDNKRLNKATTIAAKEAEELNKKAKAMNEIANKKMNDIIRGKKPQN